MCQSEYMEIKQMPQKPGLTILYLCFMVGKLVDKNIDIMVLSYLEEGCGSVIHILLLL